MPKRKFTAEDHQKASAARTKASQERIRRAHEMEAEGLIPDEIAIRLGVRTRLVREYLKMPIPTE